MGKKFFLMSVAAVMAMACSPVFAAALNGAPDNQRNDKGFYYAISSGLFPTGTTPNGDNASSMALHSVAGVTIMPPSPTPRKFTSGSSGTVSRWTISMGGTSNVVGSR